MRDARLLPSIAKADFWQKVSRAIRHGKKQVEAAQIFGVTHYGSGKVGQEISGRRSGSPSSQKKRKTFYESPSALAGGSDCESCASPLP